MAPPTKTDNVDKTTSVRRVIALTSPMVNGDDVRAFKSKLNKDLDHWNLPHRKVDESHGYAGENVFRAAALIAFCIGLSNKTVEEIRKGTISEDAQRLIRHTRTKTDLRKKVHFARSRRRRKRIRALRSTKAANISRVLKASAKTVGTTENPPGSNRGPGIISKCQINILGYDGIYWCGCYTGDLTRRVGKVARITSRVAYTPATLEDGRIGQNGFVALVAPQNAKPGDHALFNFGTSSDPVQHTGIVLRHTIQYGVPGLVCREGNTSSGSAGSQDNGGGVFDRFRPYSQVVGCARPDW